MITSYFISLTNSTEKYIEFSPLKRRKIQAEYSSGDITSDGGALLLRQMDKRLGLLEAVAFSIAFVITICI